MPNRRKSKQPPLQSAVKLFITGVILVIAAFVFPAISVSCTNEGSFQLCTETTYYGMDAHTFGIVLGIGAIICFAFGVFYLNRHKQMLEASKSNAGYSAQQPIVPPQQGAYPPAQHTSSPESNSNNASSQPPSNPIRWQ